MITMDASTTMPDPQTNPPAASVRTRRPRREIRLSQLLKYGLIRANDVFQCRKSYSAGNASTILVDVYLVVCTQNTNAGEVKFDILENDLRTVLGSFTGPGEIVKALVRRIGGLRTDTFVSVTKKVWEDFEVFRDGRSLGTIGDLRQHCYDTSSARDPTTPAVSNALHGITLPARERPSLLITNTEVGNLISRASIALALPAANTTPIVRQQQQPPQPTPRQSTNRPKQDSDERLQDTIMRELFDTLPSNHQPELFNHKHTAIYAKRYIGFLQGRVADFYKMFLLMGVTKESLADMVQKMDDGVDVAAAMRQGLEWTEAGPLGPGAVEEDEDEDEEMADD